MLVLLRARDGGSDGDIVVLRTSTREIVRRRILETSVFLVFSSLSLF